MSKDKERTRLHEMTIAEYKAFPVEEQRKIEYQMVVDTFFNRAKKEAATSIDVFEKLSVINDTNRGTAIRERHLGWLLALATCLEQSYGVQARKELQASMEGTEFSSKLENDAHTIALDIRRVVEDLMTMESHYFACLYGRKNYDLHYTSEDGDSEPFSDKELEQVQRYRGEREPPGIQLEKLETTYRKNRPE